MRPCASRDWRATSACLGPRTLKSSVKWKPIRARNSATNGSSTIRQKPSKFPAVATTTAAHRGPVYSPTNHWLRSTTARSSASPRTRPAVKTSRASSTFWPQVSDSKKQRHTYMYKSSVIRYSVIYKVISKLVRIDHHLPKCTHTTGNEFSPGWISLLLIRSTRAGLQLHRFQPLQRCVPDRLPAGFSRWTAAEFLAPLLRGEQLVRSTRHPPDFRRTHLPPVKSQDEHALQGFHCFHQRQRQERRCHCRNIYPERAGETAGGQTRQVDRSDYFFLLFSPVPYSHRIFLFFSIDLLRPYYIDGISDVISQENLHTAAPLYVTAVAEVLEYWCWFVAFAYKPKRNWLSQPVYLSRC